MKEHLAPKNSHCELCRYNNNKVCSDCVYGTGNNKLKDHYMSTKSGVFERGIVIKKADHYDEAVHYLLNYEIDVDITYEEESDKQPDLSAYHQW